MEKLKQREVKYRAWDIKNKTMEDVEELFFHPDGFIIVQYLGKEYFDNIAGVDCILLEYTGLKDKNGKEIYEGDIVKYIKYDGVPYFGNVEWDKSDEGCVDCGIASGFYIKRPCECEVAGNIYENPEL